MIRRRRQLIEIIGWAGTAAILLGYGLFSTGLVPNELTYHFFNLFGSVCLAILTYARKVWQPVIINVVFAGFAIFAILRILL